MHCHYQDKQYAKKDHHAQYFLELQYPNEWRCYG